MANTIAREGARSTLITFVGAGIGLFTTLFVLTKYLSPEEVGLTRLIIEVATLLSGLGLLGLTTSINRYFPYFKDEGSSAESSRGQVHHGFLFYVLVVALLGCLVAFPLYGLLHLPISEVFGRNSALFVDYYWLVLPLSLAIVLWTIWELYAIQLLHLSAPKTIREILLRLLMLGLYLLYAAHWLSLDGLVWGLIVVYVLCCVIALGYLGRLIPLSLKHDWAFVPQQMRRGFGRFTALAVLSTVGTMLATRMDLLMVTIVDEGGLGSTAVFSIAFFMASFIDIPTRAIISITTPHIAQAMKDRDHERTSTLYQQTSYYQLFVGLVIFALLWANIDNIYSIMPQGELYRGGKHAFLLLALAKIVEITLTGSHPIVSCSPYYHWNLYYTLGFCAVAFLANLYLIPLWGVEGAAAATLLSNLVCYGLQQGLLWHRLGIHPLSTRQLLLLPLVGVLFLLGWLLPSWNNSWIDLILRSAALLLATLGLGYVLGLSPEAEAFVRQRIFRQR